MAVDGPFFYRARLAKGAAYSAIKLWKGFPTDPVTGDVLERGYMWRCTLNGEDVDANTVVLDYDPITGLPIMKAERVEEVEYEYIKQINMHAKKYEPHTPEATPRMAVNMNAMDPIKW